MFGTFLKKRMFQWVQIRFPTSFFEEGSGKEYELVVYKENGEFYFFGNAVLWCVGHPHPARDLLIQTLEPERHSVELGEGIFLKEATVRTLTSHVPLFSAWFEKYLANCKADPLGPDCPV